MSQDEILYLIKANPGIEQRSIRREFGRYASVQIRQLLKKKEITREAVPRTFKLYPVKNPAGCAV